jgi:cytochrome c biogenesis protein
MTAGLILLGAIGLIAAIGSVISPESFFETILFKVSLLLLLLNMSLCTLNQLLKYLKKRTTGEFSKRRPIRQAALLILHAGIVLILVGGTINSFHGVRGHVAVLEGETADLSILGKSAIPFDFKLDKFEIEYNPDGSASQYYAHLSILEQDQKVKEQAISINYPLKYKGSKAYVYKYVDAFIVQGQADAGWQNEEILGEGDFFKFPNSKKSIEIRKYVPNYDPAYGAKSVTLRPDNPKVLYYVHDEGKEPKLMVVSTGRQIELEPGVFFEFASVQPYVVFIVKSDPGLLFAAIGGLMLMIGACVSFMREKR